MIMKGKEMRYKELMDLSGRCALVTGGMGHLGRTAVNTLSDLGASVIVCDKAETINRDIYGDLIKMGREIYFVTCDLEEESSRNDFLKEVQSNFNVEILVNNAAFVGTSNLSGWLGGLSDQSLETWKRALEVNLTAPFHITKSLTSSLGSKSRGTVINIGSIYGEVAPSMELYSNMEFSNPAAYAASKAGLSHLSRWLSTVLAPDIRVNTIVPGGIYRQHTDEFVKNYSKIAPLNRMANEEDFIGSIAYLASDLSIYTTGQKIVVDGGWTIR